MTIVPKSVFSRHALAAATIKPIELRPRQAVGNDSIPRDFQSSLGKESVPLAVFCLLLCLSRFIADCSLIFTGEIPSGVVSESSASHSCHRAAPRFFDILGAGAPRADISEVTQSEVNTVDGVIKLKASS